MLDYETNAATMQQEIIDAQSAINALNLESRLAAVEGQLSGLTFDTAALTQLQNDLSAAQGALATILTDDSINTNANGITDFRTLLDTVEPQVRQMLIQIDYFSAENLMTVDNTNGTEFAAGDETTLVSWVADPFLTQEVFAIAKEDSSAMAGQILALELRLNGQVVAG